MIEVKLLMPEICIGLTTIIISFFLLMSKQNKSSVIFLNIILLAGIITTGGWLLHQYIVPSVAFISSSIFSNHLSIIFKFYFLCASLFFIYTYSSRFHVMERLTIISLLLGIFFLLSSTSKLLTFSSFSLIIASVYGLALTRQRPNIQTISTVSICLILALLYGVNIPISLLLLILITIVLCFKADNSSIEALIILFIIPTLVYLSLRYTLSVTNPLFSNSLRLIGLISITTSSILMLSGKNAKKRMIKYGFFYIGHILFALGINTLETNVLAIILLFFLPFIYLSKPNFISIFNLAMIPPSPLFLVKLSILSIIIKKGFLLDGSLIVISSLVFVIYSAIDLYRERIFTKKMEKQLPTVLKIISIIVIIASLVYFDNLKNVLKTTIQIISG